VLFGRVIETVDCPYVSGLSLLRTPFMLSTMLSVASERRVFVIGVAEGGIEESDRGRNTGVCLISTTECGA
jgi:hypothetical protein